MAKTLVAHEQTIQKVFSDDYVFSIPDYQRPYSWTTEQARELLEDLLGFVEANPGPVMDMPSYFLGSIVLIKVKADAPEADVVDGQQRLTTLTLLLAAIRANISIEKQRGQITKRLYEEGDTFAGTEDRFRLTLRQRDAEFFQKYVQREGGFSELLKLEAGLVDSRQNLRDNARLFQSRLESMAESMRIELAQFILQQCYLVIVSTADEDSAYRIFSVLNSRGLDLSATDILKAKIIGGIPDKQRDGFTKKWEDAEEELGRDDFNTLFGHIRTVYRKAKAKETLLKEFEEYVTEVKAPVKFIDGVLLPMVQAYAELSASAYSAPSHAEKVNEHLRWLNRLEFNDWVPPALAFSVRNRENPSAMETFVRDLERIAYFMLVTSKGVNDRIERFAKVTGEIEANKDLSLESSAMQLQPPEQLAFFDKLNGPIYEDLSAKARTPVLLRLDSLLSGGGASYDYAVITVEHVLPQTPKAGSAWLEWFPDQAMRVGTVHRLGNLALLTRRKNAQASNWDFDRKKDSYFRREGVSPFVLTTQVIDETTWVPAVLAARQNKLMGILEKHWRLNKRMSSSDWLLKNFETFKP